MLIAVGHGGPNDLKEAIHLCAMLGLLRREIFGLDLVIGWGFRISVCSHRQGTLRQECHRACKSQFGACQLPHVTSTYLQPLRPKAALSLDNTLSALDLKPPQMEKESNRADQ